MPDSNRQFLESENDLTTKVGVKCVMYNPEGSILLLRRNPNIEWMTRKGGWDFPGGAVDFGEQPDKAVIRETKEETGLTILDPKIITAQGLINNKDEQVLIIGYTAQTTETDVQLSMEHDAFEWTDPIDIAQYKLPELHSKILSASRHT